MCPDWLAPWQRGPPPTVAHRGVSGRVHVVDVRERRRLREDHPKNHAPPGDRDRSDDPGREHHRFAAHVDPTQYPWQRSGPCPSSRVRRTRHAWLLHRQGEGWKTQGQGQGQGQGTYQIRTRYVPNKDKVCTK